MLILVLKKNCYIHNPTHFKNYNFFDSFTNYKGPKGLYNNDWNPCIARTCGTLPNTGVSVSF